MNRQLSVALVVLMLATGMISAVTVQERFLQGNEAYASGSFRDALAVYESIEHKGPGVWYNMGNASFSLGDYPHSLLYWYRAYPTTGNIAEESLRANRALVYQQGTKRVQKYAIWYDKLQRYYTYCSAKALQQIIFLLWVIALFVCILIRRHTITRVVRIGVYVWILLFAYAMVGLYFYYRTTTEPLAIVTRDAQVYAGPADWYAPLTAVQKADEVICLRKQDGWAKILTHDEIGWVDAQSIEQVYE